MNGAEVLFHKFPRFVGPGQHMIYSREQLIQHIFTNSGSVDCFTSVYPFPFNSFKNPLIDKVFWESDDDPEESLKIGQKMFEWSTEHGFTTVPNWTGNHSPHIYPLCTNTYLENAQKSQNLIKKFTYLMLEETGLYKTEKVKNLLGEMDTVKIPLIDSKIIGDLRRLTRYPTTRRATLNGTSLPTFCITLNPETFLDLSIKDIYDLEKYPDPQPYKFKEIKQKSFSELDLNSVNLSEWRSADTISTYKNDKIPQTAISQIHQFIKILLPRPCIHNFLIHPEAPFPIRYAATVELAQRKLTPNYIQNLFKQIGWKNYNHTETSKQIFSICSKDIESASMGKKKMVEAGFCIPTDCNTCKNCRG